MNEDMHEFKMMRGDGLSAKCEVCKWCEECICVVCEEGFTVVCTIKHKHVRKDGYCERFEKARK